jgi:hypothetical protein
VFCSIKCESSYLRKKIEEKENHEKPRAHRQEWNSFSGWRYSNI